MKGNNALVKLKVNEMLEVISGSVVLQVFVAAYVALFVFAIVLSSTKTEVLKTKCGRSVERLGLLYRDAKTKRFVSSKNVVVFFV